MDILSVESDQYEAVARSILAGLRDHLGFTDVHGKRNYPGKSGAQWEIDASCYREGVDTLVLVECRRKTTRRVPQEEMGGLAFRIRDVGANEGLMVTPIGYQEGAKKVAGAARIGLATLNPDATESEYVLVVADKLFRGLLVTDTCVGTDRVFVSRKCSACGSELVASGDGQTFVCPVCSD